MRLQWVGQTCFFVEAQNGRSLLIDPYQRVIGLRRGEFPADVVVFTHTHIDHYDPTAVAPNASIIMGPGFHEVNGFRMLGVKAYHDHKEGLLSGEVTIFSIVLDGFRIVHLSDLGEDLDDVRIAQLGQPDVLLFPAGEHTTISLQQSMALVHRFNPRIAIPMSYHLPGLLMPAASLENVKRAFPDHLCAAALELIPGQRLAPNTEIRILDAIAYPPVVPVD